MREMVLRNQVLLGTVNAGPEAFASALRDLDAFRRRWPAVVRTLIAGRYPPEQAPDLILGGPAGIKSVITFDVPVAGSVFASEIAPHPGARESSRPGDARRVCLRHSGNLSAVREPRIGPELVAASEW